MYTWISDTAAGSFLLASQNRTIGSPVKIAHARELAELMGGRIELVDRAREEAAAQDTCGTERPCA